MAICQKTVVINRQMDYVMVTTALGNPALPWYPTGGLQADRGGLWVPLMTVVFSMRSSRGALGGDCDCSWMVPAVHSEQLPVGTLGLNTYLKCRCPHPTEHFLVP